MNRPRLIRGIKITWTVFCGIACVLLCVLWVRSYWHADSITRVGNDLVLSRLGTCYGIFFFAVADYKMTPNIPPPDITDGWEYQEYDGRPHPSDQAWLLECVPDTWLVGVPAWFATLAVTQLAIAPWIRQLRLRFSLGTLLIVTTLVAVVLGVVVCAVR
jgi:hypothetical protein